MHILSWAKLRDFIDRHPDSIGPMRTWFDCLESRLFKDFNDVRSMFPSVDRVRLKSGQDRFVFNVSGNNDRIICGIHFNRGKVYVRFVLTHAEYDKGAWNHEEHREDHSVRGRSQVSLGQADPGHPLVQNPFQKTL